MNVFDNPVAGNQLKKTAPAAEAVSVTAFPSQIVVSLGVTVTLVVFRIEKEVVSVPVPHSLVALAVTR